MRARSYTIYAKESPFKKPDPNSPKPSTDTAFIACSPRAKYDWKDVDTLFESFGPMTECVTKDVFSGDYSSPSNMQDNLSNASTCIDGFRSRCVSGQSYDEIFDEEIKESKLCRVMVIGGKDTPKRWLVDAICPGIDPEEGVSSEKEGKFDLVTRKVEKENMIERYHFWMKEAGQGERRHGELWNVYYRTCSAFFLVCNGDDKQGLEDIEHQINVIQGVSNRDALLILVMGQEMGKEDIQRLQEKYGIKMVLDADGVSRRGEEIRGVLGGLMK